MTTAADVDARAAVDDAGSVDLVRFQQQLVDLGPDREVALSAGTLREILSRLVSSGTLCLTGPHVQDYLAVGTAEEDLAREDASPRSVGPGGGVLTRLGRQKLEGAIRQLGSGPLGLRDALAAALCALDRDGPLSSESRRVLEGYCGSWFFFAGEVCDLLSTLADAEMRRAAYCFRGRGLVEALGGNLLPAEAVSLGEVREFLGGASVSRPVALMARSIDLAVKVVAGDRSEVPQWARDELTTLVALVDRGALALLGRADHRRAWSRGLRALISAIDRHVEHFTSPLIDEVTRGVLITIEEWCWRRFRLTRPWPDPPGCGDLGGAFLDVRRLLDGTGAFSYPRHSRDQLLSLLVEETSPLVAEERAAVRRLIDAADLAVAGVTAARGMGQQPDMER